jgi:hypothetical protein
MATVSSAAYALPPAESSVPFTKVAGVRIPVLSCLNFLHLFVLVRLLLLLGGIHGANMMDVMRRLGGHSLAPLVNK